MMVVRQGIVLLTKRTLDITISCVVLLCLLPVIFLISLVIKLTMPGPVFFTQRRVGRDGHVFCIIKFRTMIVNKEMEAEAENYKVSAEKDRERTPKVGQILRRFKLDEIPQLVNVLKGDMSIVGPRPTLERHVNAYDHYEMQRLIVRPGMTGLAQVSGGTKIPWDERIRLDIE